MKNLSILGPLFIILAAMLWALDGVILRPNLYSLPVPTVVLIEHALAFLFMLPFFLASLKDLKKLKKNDWGAFFWVALFGGAIGTMAITKALFYVNFVNLSVVVLIQKLQPVFALILAAIILKERLPKKFFFWAGLAIIATYFVTFEDFVPNFATGDKTLAAALFSLLAAFAFGSSTVFSKRAIQKVSFALGTYLRFGLTTIIMFLIAASLGNLSAISDISKTQWVTFLIIVFSSGGLAMLFYYFGLKKVPASVSTICELAYPVSAIIFEFIIRHRMLTLIQWLAALMLFVAIYKISISQKALAEKIDS